MQLIIAKTQHNFYESFSDLIFNALVLFLILILFLVLKVNTETQNAKQSYIDKLKTIEVKAGMIAVDSERLKALEVERKELKTANWELLNLNAELKEQQQEMIIEKQKLIAEHESQLSIIQKELSEKKLIEAQLAELKAKVGRNTGLAGTLHKDDRTDHNASVDLNKFSGVNTGTVLGCSIMKTAAGDILYAPVPADYATMLRYTLIGVDNSDFLRNMIYRFDREKSYMCFFYDEMQKIVASIKHAGWNSGESLVKGQLAVSFIPQFTAFNCNQNEVKNLLATDYQKYLFRNERTVNSGKKNESPVLEFSTNVVATYPKGRIVFDGREQTPEVKFVYYFIVGGVKMPEAKFRWLLSAFEGGEISVKYVGEKETDIIPEWAQFVIEDCGFKKR